MGLPGPGTPSAGELSLSRADRVVSNDVQPVLARAGCNLGVCHGNKNGKGGFKLTLRGQDPAQDYVTLTRDLFGRRVDLAEPERSLLLLKATGQVSHEGGLRFTPESDELPHRRRVDPTGRVR